MLETIIRPAEREDIPRLLEIYSYYVKKTAITFEYEVPGQREFTDRFESITELYPYIAAEIGGVTVGYAYANKFHERKAYSWCAELTVYVDERFHMLGIGKMLYAELERILKAMGVTNLYACIAVPETDDEYLNSNSIDFHRHIGFEQVGLFHKCGYKFGRWYDMVYAEKLIGVHYAEQPDIVPYEKL